MHRKISAVKASWGSQSDQVLGRSARPANLDCLIEELMEPIGRQARRRAAEAIRNAA
jgi:hypothetical protein